MDIIKKHAKWFADRMRNDKLESIAAHGAYFIIISFLPFVTFLLTLFQEINFSGTSVINEALRIFPPSVAQYLEGLLAQSVPASSILSVSIITFLWSASSGMLAIIQGLDSIYSVDETRGFIKLRLLSILYLVIFAVVLLLTAITLVFGSTIYQHIMAQSPHFVAIFLINFKSLFGFILLIFFFCLIFNAVPKRSVKFRHNLIGAVFAAGGWVLFSFFFSIFVENFSNFSVVYGSLATLIVLMFWLYTCMYIMFLGAEIAVWFETTSIVADVAEIFRRKKHKRRLKKTIQATMQTRPEAENADDESKKEV